MKKYSLDQTLRVVKFEGLYFKCNKFCRDRIFILKTVSNHEFESIVKHIFHEISKCSLASVSVSSLVWTPIGTTEIFLL